MSRYSDYVQNKLKVREQAAEESLLQQCTFHPECVYESESYRTAEEFYASQLKFVDDVNNRINELRQDRETAAAKSLRPCPEICPRSRQLASRFSTELYDRLLKKSIHRADSAKNSQSVCRKSISKTGRDLVKVLMDDAERRRKQRKQIAHERSQSLVGLSSRPYLLKRSELYLRKKFTELYNTAFETGELRITCKADLSIALPKPPSGSERAETAAFSHRREEGGGAVHRPHVEHPDSGYREPKENQQRTSVCSPAIDPAAPHQ